LSKNPQIEFLEFESIPLSIRTELIQKITKLCKKYVLGALYQDMEGCLYEFDLRENGIFLSYDGYSFMLKYKIEIEKLNYYAWAKFLESVNNDNVLIRLLDKLELATPKRHSLQNYRYILEREFEYNNCFYCGKKLGNKIHVDHFIPWSYVKDDKLWNFVLSCPKCNIQKNNKVPCEEFLEKMYAQNNKLLDSSSEDVQLEITSYKEDILKQMWYYAKISGIKEYYIKGK